MLHMTPVDAGPPRQQRPATDVDGRLPPSLGSRRQHRGQSGADPDRLAPEDAFYAHSPPRRLRRSELGDGAAVAGHRRKEKERGRSGSRRRKGAWKKLLWVKQSYPDNYTDEETFLDHLQRNPRLQPYDFWPLVADSTVIVQHLCSVIIFVCCFVGIFQERASAVAVVGCGSAGTVVGWVLWDYWVSRAEAAEAAARAEQADEADGEDGSSASSASSASKGGRGARGREEHGRGGRGKEGRGKEGRGQEERGQEEHGKEEHGKEEHGKKGHVKEEHGKEEHVKEEHGKALHGKEEHGKEGHVKEEHGKALHGKEEHGKEEHGKTLHGKALHGKEEHVKEEHSKALHGKEEHGKAPHGKEQRGKALRGKEERGQALHGLGLHIPAVPAPGPRHAHGGSATSISSPSPLAHGPPANAATFAGYGHHAPRAQQRLATGKSAVLIYCALLGLSPILKSLTRSTTSDSIWNMSCWLMGINVFFFDYGGGMGVKFPASLSTNAALMASTVLASRLPSTAHVFSLTLFSIEVFGLFPAFRRHLRHISWRGHLALTVFLVAAAGAGVGVTVSGGGWKAALAGVLLGGLLTGLAMGGCSWWLIGLQKYKNEIHGPWDPARPVIRRHWD